MSSSSKPSIWNKGVLIPIWLTTLVAVILCVVSATLKFNLYSSYLTYPGDLPGAALDGVYHDYFYYQEALAPACLAWGIVLIVFSTATLVTNILSVAFLAGRRLHPAYIVSINAVSFVVWTTLLVCSLGTSPTVLDIFQLIAECLLTLTSAGQLIYGAVLLKRVRRCGLQQTKTVVNDASIFDTPAPDYETVVGADMQKVHDAK